jgi:hypothetical protein
MVSANSRLSFLGNKQVLEAAIAFSQLTAAVSVTRVGKQSRVYKWENLYNLLSQKNTNLSDQRQD